MSRIPALDPAATEGKTRELLAAVNASLGVTPNLFRVAANAPSVLEGLVALNGALTRTSLGARTRESVALTVAETNGCDYCLSAHSALGAGAGLTAPELGQARDAVGRDPKTTAILRLARSVVIHRGQLPEAELVAARAAGLNDRELLETVGLVVLNVFTNYVNLLADTEIDFPVVRAAKR